MKTKTVFKIKKSFGATLPSGKPVTRDWFKVVQFDDGFATAIWWEGSSAKDAKKKIREARATFTAQ